MTRAIPTTDSTRLVATTYRALFAPRRLVPMLVVAGPMLVAQAAFGRGRGEVLVAFALCLLFTLAPVGYRVLFAPALPRATAPLRVVLYVAFTALAVGVPGWLLPRALRSGDTFLTTPINLLIDGALFAVGGWGLGRDVEFEERLGRERARADEFAREAERAQLLALRSHLDPHFLFNTLNAIAEWCRDDGEVAERAILQLSSMLRTLTEGVRAPRWPLARELELVRTLFALHAVRDAERFRVDYALAPDLPPTDVPPLLLLPLAENAMKYGPERGHRGDVKLSVSRRGERVVVRLENPGRFGGERSGGTGLETVRKRLALAYEGRASLRLSTLADATVAEVFLPLGTSGETA